MNDVVELTQKEETEKLRSNMSSEPKKTSQTTTYPLSPISDNTSNLSLDQLDKMEVYKGGDNRIAGPKLENSAGDPELTDLLRYSDNEPEDTLSFDTRFVIPRKSRSPQRSTMMQYTRSFHLISKSYHTRSHSREGHRSDDYRRYPTYRQRDYRSRSPNPSY